MKKFYLLLVVLMCFAFYGCDNCDNNESISTNVEKSDASESSVNVEIQQEEVIDNITSQYFESDGVVDKFFSDYNAVAEVVIPAEAIKEGNIRTKAMVYIDDLSLEITNANDFLFVSMSSSVDNEETKLYSVFRDVIKTMNIDTADEDIQSAWNGIHETGYLVENYDFKGIIITYVPSKNLSWGASALRVDLKIPLM